MLQFNNNPKQQPTKPSNNFLPPAGKKFFLAIVPGGHVGAGRQEDRGIFLVASTTIEACKILKNKVGGWKRNRIPNIHELSDVDKIKELHSEIINTPNFTVEKFFQKGYFHRKN